MVVGMEWYPKNRGFVTGLIVSILGMSGFFWGYLSTYLVNPDAVKPIKIDNEAYFEIEIANRIPSMYSKLIGIWIVLFIIAISLVTRPTNIKESND